MSLYPQEPPDAPVLTLELVGWAIVGLLTGALGVARLIRSRWAD